MLKELRDYQKDILSHIDTQIREKKPHSLIAACPSSGKTLVALHFIKNHPNSKVLVIPHGTNVIKNQWDIEMKECGITNATTMIHQEINIKLKKDQIKILKEYDYLIVDEAHKFTFAEQTSKNLDKLNFKHVIYLTGTPSKFIAKGGYEPYVVAALDVVEMGYISDLWVRLVSSNVKFTDKDLNDSGDVRFESVHKLEKTVDGDLDALLEKMHIKLKATGSLTDTPEKVKLKLSKNETSGWLRKTMIATESIIQANKVEKYFKKKGVSVLQSNYQTDPDSENIKKFEDDPTITVLVVVNRAILGFNMTDLVNVVDMTGSYNIDRIYQLYARVMRKHPVFKEKFFYKIVPETRMDYYKFFMTAALCLMNKDFIEKYNGKNVNRMEIPIDLKPKTIKNKDSSGGGSKPSGDGGKRAIDKLFYETVSATKLLIDIYNKKDQELNEYAFRMIGDIRREEFGENISKPIVNITEEQFVAFLKTGELDEAVYG